MHDSLLEAATQFAWLTPPGRGAIAVLAVHGARAWPVLRELFQPVSGRPLPESANGVEPGRFWLGWLGEAGHGQRDQVVLAVKQVNPCPTIEVHCHGGLEVARLLDDLFTARGLRRCSWEEFTRDTRDDLGRATALAALAKAPTVRVAGILLDQFHGAFEQALAVTCAALEKQQLEEGERLLNGLARHVVLGRHLTAPWRVAILGPPNVGKSSLANRLAGFQRSIVSDVPGTTRDMVATFLAVDGWPVELIDTAGWRAGMDDLERQGIELARQAAAEADLCLWVLDGSNPPVWPGPDLPRMRLLINKTDLPAAWDPALAAGAPIVSALTGAGIPDLLGLLSGWLVPDPPPPGVAVPFTAELCGRVEEARALLAVGEPKDAVATLRGSDK
jgi:tRNA modification GTPase